MPSPSLNIPGSVPKESDLDAGSPRIQQIPSFAGGRSTPRSLSISQQQQSRPAHIAPPSSDTTHLSFPSNRKLSASSGPKPSNLSSALSRSENSATADPSSSSAVSNDTGNVTIDQISEEEKARIVRRHLVVAPRDVDGKSRTSSHEREDFPAPGVVDDNDVESPVVSTDPSEPTVPTYHNLLGGDMVHDVYKYAQDAQQAPIKRPRSASFTSVRAHFDSAINPSALDHAGGEEGEDPRLNVKSMLEPGGMRRNYIARKAADSGAATDAPQQQPKFTKKCAFILDLRKST